MEELACRGIHPLLHRYHDTSDGTFPNGVPNPLLPENRAETCEAVRQHGAQLGVAFDGDFDRCFFLTSTATLSRATTSSVCSPIPCWPASQAAPIFMTPD